MDQENSISYPHKPILVYYKARGSAQLIRNVLLEIDIPFQEVYVSCSQGIPQDLAKRHGLSLNNIPYLIHEDKVICQQLIIIRYCCSRFNRQDLMGVGSLNEIKIMQILTNYENQKSRVIKWVIDSATQLAQLNSIENKPQNVEIIKQNLLKKIKKLSLGEALKKIYMRTNGFLFGSLTIVDFIFHQFIFNVTGLLSTRLNQENSVLYLYKNFFQNLPYYKKNKDRLQSYKMIVPDVPIYINKIFLTLWQGDKKFVQC